MCSTAIKLQRIIIFIINSLKLLQISLFIFKNSLSLSLSLSPSLPHTHTQTRARTHIHTHIQQRLSIARGSDHWLQPMEANRKVRRKAGGWHTDTDSTCSKLRHDCGCCTHRKTAKAHQAPVVAHSRLCLLLHETHPFPHPPFRPASQLLSFSSKTSSTDRFKI